MKLIESGKLGPDGGKNSGKGLPQPGFLGEGKTAVTADVTCMPQDVSGFADPLKYANFVAFGSYLQEIIDADRTIGEEERTAIVAIAKKLTQLSGVCRRENRADFAEEIQAHLNLIKRILGSSPATTVSTATTERVARLFVTRDAGSKADQTPVSSRRLNIALGLGLAVAAAGAGVALSRHLNKVELPCDVYRYTFGGFNISCVGLDGANWSAQETDTSVSATATAGVGALENCVILSVKKPESGNRVPAKATCEKK